jgi:hypothetical protein
MPLDAALLQYLGIGSGWTLAGSFFWLIYTGRLVTLRQHEREVAYREVRIAEERADRDTWREAHETSEQARAVSEQARAVQAAQLDRLLGYAETADHLLRSLPGGDQS